VEIMPGEPLPSHFRNHLTELERRYLAEVDPARQSGFSGGAARWYAERSPILAALPGSCELLDVGCANGYLLECLMRWGVDLGLTLVPFGLDCGTGLIELARKRMPKYADHFFVGNAWDWSPPRSFACVYSLFDCVPRECFGPYLKRLLELFVAPGGRLIIGAYGNRSRGEARAPIDSLLTEVGMIVTGTASGGSPEMTRLAWVDAVESAA
jgi:SAM-dependent methyltransferase